MVADPSPTAGAARAAGLAVVRTGLTALVLLEALDGFDAEAYLLDAGVSAQDVAALRRRLAG